MGLRFTKRFAAASVAVVAAAAVAVGLPASSSAAAVPTQQAFGILSGGTVMAAFKTNNPAQLDWVRAITGLTGNDKFVVGIDFRPQDNKLYAVGNAGGIYTISLPTSPSDPPPTATKVSQLQVALHGTSFGVDFNPLANRLRIVSDTGQNLRHDVVGGVTNVDKNLTLNGSAAHGVTGVAYTNNDLSGDSGTLLFAIDTNNDQLTLQLPPNDGVQNPIGKLGVPFSLDVGFDFYSDLSNGRTITNTPFMVGVDSRGSVSSLYTFTDTLAGSVAKIGDLPLTVSDIAVALDANP